MSSLLSFEREKFIVLCVETAAAKKEVPTSLLEETWASLEVSKVAPEEILVEVKAAFKELYSNYFDKEETPAKRNRIYAWDSWNLLLGKGQSKHEVEALRNREEKSVKIMAQWRNGNKLLSHKISSLEENLLEVLSQEDNGKKSQWQDNDKFDWLDMDLSHLPLHKWVWFNIHPFQNIIPALD
ncbi:hypothetical protein DSO57_1006100 [Entomophthora muscae]|uniref:Uncharacterized protein n=1 Tax=Entomophthora muscae TaxID=34485 RepID=A0ACC2TIP3_9FUNG|nr:hypothetical protein DSO57_1006100 [Entomophthora muscae]